MNLHFSLRQDAFSQVLDMLRLRGTTVVTSPPLLPQATVFEESPACIYVQQKGDVWLSLCGSSNATQIHQGDVVLLIHGGGHTLSYLQQPTHQDKQPSWLRGEFAFEGTFARQLLAGLPRIIVLSRPVESPHQWVDIACNFILDEAIHGKAGATAMVSRLLDLLVIRTLRTWASESEGGYGWLSGAVDERIGKVLTAMHRQPEHNWSIKELSDLGAMSRSAFTSRFLNVVGQSPIAYLNCWRLDRASELLKCSGQSVTAIAERVGYKSEAAFSRAFRQRYGDSPKHWRSCQQE